jgi:hypothetical protein
MSLQTVQHVRVVVTNPETQFGGVTIEFPAGREVAINFPPEEEINPQVLVI